MVDENEGAGTGVIRNTCTWNITFDDDHEEDVRELVLENAGALRIDETTGRIPKEDWGTIDLVVCLGGDGVILHASKLFQGPVPPLMGFHFGSMGFLTNHPPEQMAQSLLQSVGRGPKTVANVKGGIPTSSRAFQRQVVHSNMKVDVFLRGM